MIGPLASALFYVDTYVGDSVQGGSDVKRRSKRFKWNPEYDELAVDAGVILAVRSRSHPRTEFGVLARVFPGIPYNSARTRVHKLLNANPAYCKRLEKVWSDLWLRYRGTNELPDPNPNDLKDFDILAHIKFLRSNVDKTAMYVAHSVDRQNTDSCCSVAWRILISLPSDCLVRSMLLRIFLL